MYPTVLTACATADWLSKHVRTKMTCRKAEQLTAFARSAFLVAVRGTAVLSHGHGGESRCDED